jgi:cell division protease FtsH
MASFTRVFLFLLSLNSTWAFLPRKPRVERTPLRMFPSPLSENGDDMQIIYHSKNLFFKEDYNTLLQNIKDHHVTKLFADSKFNEIVSVSTEHDDSISSYYHLTEVNPLLVNKIVDLGAESNIPVYFADFTPPHILQVQQILSNLSGAIGYIFPLLFLFSLIRGINAFRDTPPNPLKRGGGGAGGFNPFGFGGDDDEEEFVKPNVSLSSWAGNPEVLEECKEVISYLDQKEAYKAIGAEMPKGILLEGPPGTGKTLLAKAIATETNSTFIAMSGSEFVELFVGMGAARVRQLFESARENTPSIIFIDEIDAIGRQRGAGINMGNDEREQTLNQLLYEMDGFNSNEDIVVMAATNRKDVLDAALLRPGRFDRIIRVPLPDRESRIQILTHYLKDKRLNKPVDISAVAELTDGFSGAELKNLINEAAILSARNNYTVIQDIYLFDAFEKSIVGLIRKNATVAPATQQRVAIHETGHALLVLRYQESFDFQKVSIQPTYNGAGGYTLFSEKPEIREGGLYTKDILKKRLVITMAGKAAETIYYGNDHVSLGAIQDLRQANQLAKRMVGNYGMGEELEVFFDEGMGDEGAVFLGRTMAMGGGTQYSEDTKYIMDKESLDLVKEAYEEAKGYLADNVELLLTFADHLKTNTVLYARDIHP